MPYLKTAITDNKREYIITIVGLNEVRHSFLNYLVAEIGNTFIESYMIKLNKLHLEGIAAEHNLMLKIHLRKSNERIKYVHVTAADDITPALKRTRDVEETDNERAAKK